MSKTLIIAEAGVNHNGNIEIAYEMIEAAKNAGADIVKFQTFRALSLVSKESPKAQYQIENTDSSESQYAMLANLELDREMHLKLIEYCKATDIEFMSTPFDNESINLLSELGMRRLKIPSGEITNYPYLKHIAKQDAQLIVSTGMSNLGEVEEAIEVLTLNGSKRSNLTLLHCNTEYPTPYQDVNLRAMATMKEAFKLPIGYSDHTLGIEVPIAAVALGATVIEKHFTLDRQMVGPDHKASLEPLELKEMVSSIRNTEQSLGDGLKKVSESEKKNKEIARKSIVADCRISAGEEFSEDNLTSKRPGNGISPMRWNEVIGQRAQKNYEIDDPIE
jgi:N,N'-diacetyllegionaminate synthase